MTTEHQTTREEEAYWRLLEEMDLSKAARTVLEEAQSAAYAANMVYSYCFQLEEYEEAMEKMRPAATTLTDHECELLGKLWRAALAAAASIDADDFETPAGRRVYSGDLHWFYRMSSSMVEKILQEKKYAGFRKEIAEREPVDLPDPPF
jgi:hypothetical protein